MKNEWAKLKREIMLIQLVDDLARSEKRITLDVWDSQHIKSSVNENSIPTFNAQDWHEAKGTEWILKNIFWKTQRLQQIYDKKKHVYRFFRELLSCK